MSTSVTCRSDKLDRNPQLVVRLAAHRGRLVVSIRSRGYATTIGVVRWVAAHEILCCRRHEMREDL
jgi:hypothetical protein